MSAFYPGAGTDLTPPILFPEIKTWHYMDSQPRSEHGDNIFFYRPTFLVNLDQTMTQCGFELLRVEGTLRTYFSPSTDQTIYYETSTVFPGAWDPVKHAGSTLILCGYDIESSGPIPPSFFSSYSHILTDNTTGEDVWTKNILPAHTLSIMNYPKDDSYPYWIIEKATTENIRTFVSVQRNIKWHNVESI
jgi:hypothetical protein